MSHKLFLLLILACVFCTVQVSTLLAHELEADAVVIHMSEDGYEPAEITILEGTTVIFENVGSRPQWPAVDDHPTHTHYSGTSIEEHCNEDGIRSFDACGPIEASTEWNFVFNVLGTHEYHDHLWSHQKGTVRVVSTAPSWWSRLTTSIGNYFYKLFSFFRKKSVEVDLVNESFEKDNATVYIGIVQSQNPREAIDKLRVNSEHDDTLLAQCHDILHEIGRESFYKYGSFEDAVVFQSDFCNSGYIHGIFEAYFQEDADPMANLSGQCIAYGKQTGRPFDVWQCIHGVGHGFMYLTGGKLDTSLALCDESFPDASAGSCHNGVYMEVFNNELLAFEPDYINVQDPFATCRDRDVAQEDCYMYVPTYFIQHRDMIFTQVLNLCFELDSDNRKSCISGVASEAVKRNMNAVSETVELCRGAGSFILQESCIDAVVGMYMNQTASYEAGAALCDDMPSEFVSACTKAATDRKAFFAVVE